MNNEHNRDGKFWIGFFIGGFIGALTLFFYGTKDGKRTGKLLSDRGKDILGELEEKLDTFKKKGKELAQKGSEIGEEAVERIEKGKDVIVEASESRIEEALAHIEALQERGRETTASLRRRLFKNLPKKS